MAYGYPQISMEHILHSIYYIYRKINQFTDAVPYHDRKFSRHALLRRCYSANYHLVHRVITLSYARA